MLDLIIKNGTVVTESDIFRADVGVKNGKIEAVGKISAPAETVSDAKGLYVLPGAIDAHTHLQMEFGGTVTSDGYESGTRAAVCGGVTTVFDYAIQGKGKGIIEAVEARKKLAQDVACADYAFHCAVTDLREDLSLLDEFGAAAAYGVTSFKCFMVYRKAGLMIDDGKLLRVLETARDAGILTNVHAENPDVIDERTARYLKDGKTGAWYHYMSRPEFVEAEAVSRAIRWASAVGAPLYIVHLACADGVRAVAEAKANGCRVYAETCPQYLEFTSDVYLRGDGRNFVCSPPMKGKESRAALWRALSDGTADTVATDHCPFTLEEKLWGKDDFTKIPNGCAGVENLYPYMLSAANAGKISFSKAVELCAYNPAKLFGCTDKGALRAGKDADIVLYDPKKSLTVDLSNMHSDYDHTIWQGVKFKGYPTKTYLRGKLVFDGGAYVGSPGDGRYIKRAAFV